MLDAAPAAGLVCDVGVAGDRDVLDSPHLTTQSSPPPVVLAMLFVYVLVLLPELAFVKFGVYGHARPRRRCCLRRGWWSSRRRRRSSLCPAGWPPGPGFT